MLSCEGLQVQAKQIGGEKQLQVEKKLRTMKEGIA